MKNSAQMDAYMAVFRARKSGGKTSGPPDRAAMERRLENVPMPKGTRIEKISMNGVPARKISVPGAREDSAMLFIHGGGFVSGSSASPCFFGTRVAEKTHQTIYSIDYRLGPEHSFLDGLDDCLCAYQQLLSSRILPENIVISGGSAGGYMSLALTRRIREMGLGMPGALVLLSPFTGFSPEPPTPYQIAADSMLTYDGNARVIESYFSGLDLNDPVINVILDDFHGFPPTYLALCTDEILYGGIMALANKLGQAAVACDVHIRQGCCHSFSLMATPEGVREAECAAAFLLDLERGLPDLPEVTAESIKARFSGSVKI